MSLSTPLSVLSTDGRGVRSKANDRHGAALLVSHRPLAFACSQLLHVAHPLAAVLGIDACAELAADLGSRTAFAA